MANLTITVDDLLLKRARIKALEEGTSVNALLRAHLERYVGPSRSHAALTDFAALTEQSEASSGSSGRSWTREELYDRSATE